ncbi:MAG TPA: amidohydrolase family protein [Solirubrobacteraceae bacterium]|nr:amidohydrolase family protein [Solirubrobacteraceae bacterium]
MSAAGRDWTIAGARALDLDAETGATDPVDVVVRDGRIASVAPAGSLAPHGGVIDATGMLVMPGLVDAHLHSSGAFERGRLDNLPLELFMLYEVPPVDAQPEPAEVWRARVLLGAAERLRTGVTSVLDDVIFSPAPTETGIDAVMSAYAESGMRATVSLYQPDKPMLDWYPYLRASLPEDLRAALDAARPPAAAEILRGYEAFSGRWHGAEAGRLRCGVSCSAPHRATDEHLTGMHALAARADLPFVLHLYESKLQRVVAELDGRSFVRRLGDLGVLDERACLVHAVWVDEQDAAELGAAGATVVHSPSGNLRCGSGIMPWRMLADAGVALALCTDEATVEDTGNLWHVGRLAAQLHKLAGPDYERWPTAREILRALTEGGAAALGLAGQVGTLAPGAHADLLLIDLETSVYTPFAELLNHLVYGEDGRSIALVMVDGNVVARGGTVLTIDEPALRRRVAELTARAGDGAAATEAWAQRLWPYVDAMYRRCAAYDVGFSRWAP